MDSCVVTAASLLTVCDVAAVISWACERVSGVEVAELDEPARPQPRHAELDESGDVTKEEEEKKLLVCPDWPAGDEEEACASAASDGKMTARSPIPIEAIAICGHGRIALPIT
jgi:hypothetical protein